MIYSDLVEILQRKIIENSEQTSNYIQLCRVYSDKGDQKAALETIRRVVTDEKIGDDTQIDQFYKRQISLRNWMISNQLLSITESYSY